MRKYTMMIVDDSKIIRNRIERCFSKTEFEIVATATNGAEAVELYKKRNPDVVTMDLTMPGVDGLECISRIKVVDPLANILVVSALSDTATGLDALRRSARGFICKPFTDEQLIRSLSHVVENSLKNKDPRNSGRR